MPDYQEPIVEDYTEIKSTPVSNGLLLGGGLFTAGKAAQLLHGGVPVGGPSATKQLLASAVLGSALGLAAGNAVQKLSSVNTNNKTANVKEINYTMNENLIRACQMAKTAADMTLPILPKPAPEVGTDPVPSMTTGSVYEDASKAAQLARAKQVAAAAATGAPLAGPAKVASLQKIAGPGYYNPETQMWAPAFNMAVGNNETGDTYAGDFYMRATEPTDNGIGQTLTNVKAELDNAYKAALPALGRAAGDARTAANMVGNNIMTGAQGAYGTAMGAAAGLGGAINGALGTDMDATMLGLGAAGLGAAGLGAAGYGAYRMANQKKEKRAAAEADMATAQNVYNDCVQKIAYAQELYADAVDYFNGDCTVKTASVVTPEVAQEAMYAAEALYNECVEKMASAQALYADAQARYKVAADLSPAVATVMGGVAGAGVGDQLGRVLATRAGAAPGLVNMAGAAGAALGAGAGVAGAAALAQ